jgi:hypothetical protein
MQRVATDGIRTRGFGLWGGEMKTTYITFKREMARAYAEGRKRMTRRVIKHIPALGDPKNWCHKIGSGKFWIAVGNYRKYCPYGQPGDQIILGTTWAVPECYDHLKPTELPKYEGTGLHDCMPIDIWSYFDSDEKPEGFGKLRPGRFLPGFLRGRMPRETLKIVRAERVQDITDEEAILEGIFETPREPGFDCWSTHGMREYYPTPRAAFKALWNSINAGRGYSWDSNPWVWALGW